MTRTQQCRDAVINSDKYCEIDRTSIIPIRKAHELTERYVEISTLSTDAIQPLLKIKRIDILESVITAIGKDIDAIGKTPTKPIVKKYIAMLVPSNEIPSPSTDEQVAKKREKILKYRRLIEALELEIEEILQKSTTETSESPASMPRETLEVNNPQQAMEPVPSTLDTVSDDTDQPFGVTEPSGTNKTIGHAAAWAKLANKTQESVPGSTGGIL